MKSYTIRLIVIVATISVLGILLIQSYWLKRAFDLREKQFDQQAQIVLNRVAKQILDYQGLAIPSENLVTQLSSNYYAVMINNPIDASLLESLLYREFSRSNIPTDFEYGIYDCQTEKLIYGNYISFQEQDKAPKTSSTLPTWPQENYYFSILFPAKEQYLAGSMAIWLFSSFVLVLVIIFFSYSTFVILKQKRLSEIQKDFINNMTHEVKTPISTILLSAEVLMKEKSYDQKTSTTYLSLITKEALRIKNHAEQVLQIANLDKEKLHPHKEVLDMHQLISEVLESLTFRLKELHVVLEVKLEATQSHILADRLHVINVLHNLLDNAIKYSSDAPNITISTYTQKHILVLSVADNGRGIAKEEQKKIFQKFYRIPTGNLHDVKGYGLGLYYVKSVMNAHNGKISLKSACNEGSNFQLSFPLTR